MLQSNSMGRLSALAVGLLVWIGLTSSVMAQRVDIAEVERSVVQIYVEEGGGLASTGTGFVLNAQGMVGTNFHVVKDLKGSLAVRQGNSKEWIEGRVVTTFPQFDLAIIQVDGLGLPPIKLAVSEQKKGEEVWALGFPGAASGSTLEVDATFTKGVISRMDESPWNQTWNVGGPAIKKIQHTAAINGGNSGGPLTNICGAVIGVNTAGALIQSADGSGQENANDVYLASHVSVLIGALQSRGITYTPAPDACVLSVASGVDEQRVADAEADAEEAKNRADEAGETAKGAFGAAKEAGDKADDAIEKTERLQGETEDLKAELGSITRQLIIWGPILAVLIIAALGLALRKPRERIIRTVTEVKEGISRKIEKSGTARRKRQAEPKYGLSLAGFDSRGSPVQVLMSKENFDGRFGSVVGRHPEFSDFTIQDTDVSRRHFRIFWEKAQAKIEDLNTTNGTVLNQQILTPFLPQIIGPGDRVLIGGIELTVSKL